MTSEKLTASELSQLWGQYLNDSLYSCQIKYCIHSVDDPKVKRLLKDALTLSEQHIEKLSALFKNEKMPIPQGFNEQDVNLESPKLFEDDLKLKILLQLGNYGLRLYGLAITMVTRKDVHEHFCKCLEESIVLHTEAKNLALDKGIYIKAPIIAIPTHISQVNRQSFLAGWFDRRPLTSIEIAHLFSSIKRITLEVAMFTGYSQVTRDQKIKQFFMKGKEVGQKHYQTLTTILTDNDLPAPAGCNNEITESTIAPFSDKLMLFEMLSIISYSIGLHGVALSFVARRDLGLTYMKFISSMSRIAEEGFKLMIDHNWLEQPPMASDRNKIAQHS
ncbi:MAG: DUF3231 family protein [Sporolactobacillus sp.]